MGDDPASRIQDAATALFAEHGFDGVSVRDIARRAGVTVGSINYYFGSKDALYQECGRRLCQAYLAEARARFERDGPRAVLEHFVEYAVRDPRLMQVWLDLQGARDPEKRGFSSREIMRPVHAFLVDALGRMGDRTLERRLRMLCFVGAVLLRSMLTEDQFQLLMQVPAEEGDAHWKEILFSRLIDDG